MSTHFVYFTHLIVSSLVTTYHFMDVTWFKQKQKQAGATTADIAEAMGRDRSIVSHIYSGRQRMSLDWAKAFADVLKVPLDEVLTHADVLDGETVQQITLSPSGSDVDPFTDPGTTDHKSNERINALGGGRPGTAIWTVKTTALALGGYLPNDHIIVDTLKAEHCKAGDVVLARVYDRQSGLAITLLRRFEPPALVAATNDPTKQRIHIVDGNNVAIIGKVIASWRSSK